jgi:hypothetical protein
MRPASPEKGSIMKRMVRYKLKADRVDENERLVRAVYQEHAERRPTGLRYATFKLEDGVSFVHIASHEAPDGSNLLTALPAFKAFVAGVRERCEEPPVTVGISEIGAYGFFGS